MRATDLARAGAVATALTPCAAMREVARNSTAVWTDRVGAVPAGRDEACVNSGRVDRRPHRGNRSDRSGACTWMKPPGESGGIATKADGPNDEGEQHDPMCDPAHRGDDQAGGGDPTGALADAPHDGPWFPGGFTALVRNAYPAL